MLKLVNKKENKDIAAGLEPTIPDNISMQTYAMDQGVCYKVWQYVLNMWMNIQLTLLKQILS